MFLEFTDEDDGSLFERFYAMKVSRGVGSYSDRQILNRVMLNSSYVTVYDDHGVMQHVKKIEKIYNEWKVWEHIICPNIVTLAEVIDDT